MQFITSHSIPLRMVIQDLAKEFGVPVKQNCNEYHLDIPTAFGEGSIRGIDMRNGLGLIFYDCTFQKDLTIRFIVDTVHPLKFIYCEAGKISHGFEDDDFWRNIEPLDSLIVASARNKGHVLKFQAGQKTVLNSLEVNRKEFYDQNSCIINKAKTKLKPVFKDLKAERSFSHHSKYSIKLADLFMEYKEFAEEPFLNFLFSESIATKILIYQIRQYHDDITAPNHKSILRKSEIKQVWQAAAIIEENVAQIKSVKDLAEEVGLNINKLQNGFKSIYGCTVNDYVHNQRLAMANHLLKNTEMNVSEIVYKIGLSSKSYFSKIYKEKYGVSPSDVGKNKNNHGDN